MGKIIGKNTSKNLSDKYSQVSLDHAKWYAKQDLKTASKKSYSKKAIVAGIFTCNKIEDNITETFLNKPIVLSSVAMVLVEFQHWCKILFLKI